MRIFNNAKEKIDAFNQNLTDNNPKDYHSVLSARKGNTSVVDLNGQINNRHLKLIDKVLRGYFMMNRGNRMGRKGEFTIRLGGILSSRKLKKILVSLRSITILSSNLEKYRSKSEKLYEALSSRECGLSGDHTYFCVGATKILPMLFPELFIMLDKNVGKACGYSPGQYNNFQAYWKVTKLCYGELIEWNNKYGSIDNLLCLDKQPTHLTRIFDKCATMMGLN